MSYLKTTIIFFGILFLMICSSNKINADDLIIEFDEKLQVKKTISLPFIDHLALEVLELKNGNLLISSRDKFFEYSDESKEQFKRIYITKEGFIVGELDQEQKIFLSKGNLAIYSPSGEKLRNISIKIKDDYYVKKALLINNIIIAWIDGYEKNLLAIDLEGNILWGRFLNAKNFNVYKDKILIIIRNEEFEISPEKYYQPIHKEKSILLVLDSTGKVVDLKHIKKNIKNIVELDNKNYILLKRDNKTILFLNPQLEPIAKFDQIEGIYSFYVASKDKIFVSGEGKRPGEGFTYSINKDF
ncbi:hypothetical protein EOM09_04295 [bacterium]|nr:hypothetical protein [bacterium]